MSMQCAQGVLLFLVRFNNSARFEIYGVTRSSSSHPFSCALVQSYTEEYHEFVAVCIDMSVQPRTTNKCYFSSIAWYYGDFYRTNL